MAALLFMLLFLHFHLTPAQVGELIFEDGYTVSTVLDGDKSNIKVNPHSVLHPYLPSDLFILLDSVASTFYTVSLPSNSNETVMKRFAGNGASGYNDGDLASAQFNKPGSFAIDFKGNVYVADYYNHAIRKITKTGVTTIAGGYTQKEGRMDGPARDASFSNNFELTFIPPRCALMISDHGNRLIRQINLKAADCTNKHSGSVLGTTSAWFLGLGLSCLLSLIIGFVVRPYVLPYEGIKRRPHCPSWTWTHCLTNQGRQIMMLCSDIRSVIVKSTVYSLFHQMILLSLSQLSLMFRPMMVESHTVREKTVSLMDMDMDMDEVCTYSGNSSIDISPRVSDQLKDLLAFDGGLIVPVNSIGIVEQEEDRESSDASSCYHKKINGIIQENLVNFEGLVKRR